MLSSPTNIERDQIHISGAFSASLPDDSDNLILHAIAKMRQALHVRNIDAPAVCVELLKRLPVASGIGGGSADAAATLRGVCKLWNYPLNDLVLELALELGADVPMCLQSRTLQARGIGEIITFLKEPQNYHLLLVNPGINVSTMDVFGSLEKRENTALPSLPSIEDLPIYRNDLQCPAIAHAPVIRTVLDEISALPDIDFVRMSGSGATCFGIFETANQAQKAANVLQRKYPEWWIASTFPIDETKELTRVFQ